VQSEPAGEGPEPFEVDASDPSWSWEETVRRAREAEQAEYDGPGVPPALPPEVWDHARSPRSTTGTVRVRSKGSGWVWVGLVLFLLIYGCSKATKPSKQVNDSWDGHLPDPRGDVEEDEAFLRREVDRLRREAARTGR